MYYPPKILSSSSSDPGFACSFSTEPLELAPRFVVVSLGGIPLPFPFPRIPAAALRASAVARVCAFPIGLFAGSVSALLGKVVNPVLSLPVLLGSLVFLLF